MSHWIKVLKSRPCAMERRALEALSAQVSSIDLSSPQLTAGRQLALPTQQAADQRDFAIVDGTAIIPITGSILKAVPWFFEWYGIEATGTEQTRARLAMALASMDVERIVLDIDSPGGTIAGVPTLADDIFEARGIKPIVAHVQDMAASAALWIAAQADEIVVGPSAAVGSIGVYAVVDDWSERFRMEGVKTHVVSSHELKGAFVEGSEITEAQIADLQREIDTLTSHFVAAVSRGRGMSEEAVRALATGQVWHGQEAIDKGLADRVSSQEQTPVEQDTEAPESPVAEVITMPQGTHTSDKERADAAEAKYQAVLATQRATLLDKYSDRIQPSAKAHIQNYADAIEDMGELEAFLKALPTVTRESPVSQPADNPARITAPKRTLAQRQLARVFKTPPEEAEKINAIVLGVWSNGTFLIRDDAEDNGERTVTKEELDQLLAS